MTIQGARLLDLQKREGYYRFRIAGDEFSFSEALKAVKRAFIHGRERHYNPETHEWIVPATEESEQKLSAIFPNAGNAFLALHSQMRMF
jgi:hypothetical protein